MPLIEQSVTPEPQELTVEQLQQRLVQRTQNIARNGIQQVKTMHALLLRNIWEHPKLTPQQAFDSFGVKAVELFQLSNAIINLVNSVSAAENYSYVPPYHVTLNPDGSVTIGDAR